MAGCAGRPARLVPPVDQARSAPGKHPTPRFLTLAVHWPASADFLGSASRFLTLDPIKAPSVGLFGVGARVVAGAGRVVESSSRAPPPAGHTNPAPSIRSLDDDGMCAGGCGEGAAPAGEGHSDGGDEGDEDERERPYES